MSLDTGDWAYDTEQRDDDTDAIILIVETTTTPADEYVYQEMPEPDPDLTVASANPRYDETDHVVLGVYRDSLDDELDSLTRQAIVDRYSDGRLPDKYVYAFPRSRLEKVRLHDLD